MNCLILKKKGRHLQVESDGPQVKTTVDQAAFLGFSTEGFSTETSFARSSAIWSM
jgi:hypothetical protein